MTIEEMKSKIINEELECGIYTSDDKIIIVDSTGFQIRTPQDNGWTRVHTYEYLGLSDIDNDWVMTETYERGE